MRLLWIWAAATILIIISIFAFPKAALPTLKKSVDTAKAPQTSILPVISPGATFPIISAQAALAVDLDTGTYFYEKNSDQKFLPASTTKIITALTAMDYYPGELVVRIGKIKVDGQKMGLVEGESLKVIDLLYGLLVFSANDAAEALATNFPGGREFFVTAMNLKAAQYGLKNSYFTNPSGLDGDFQVTTAQDLEKISQIAMANSTFSKIVATKEITIKSTDAKFSHKLVNINQLLGQVDGVLGVKTGWTENARENLVTYLERDGKKIMIVVLGSQDRFGETKELINWIFKSYEWKEVPYYSP